MAERTITLKLSVDTSGAITAVNDFVAQAPKSANALETPFANIAARGFAIKSVVDGITASFGAWIRESNAGEAAQVKFQQSVRNAGGAVEAETASIKAYASARQAATGIDDDATIAVAAQLRAMKLQGDQLEQAIALTQDLSTLMDGDMSGAVRVIGDAFNGNTGMLKRYVKGLDETDIKQRGTISIIEQLTKAVGGQAEAVGSTGVGQMKKFDAALGDLQQTFGDLLKDALVPVVSILTEVLQWLVAAPKPLQVVALGVTTLAGAFTLLGTSMGGIPFIIGGVVTGVAALVTWIDDLTDEQKEVPPVTKATGTALDDLRRRIANLKVEAQDTDAIKQLREEIEKLQNPVTELSLRKELNDARKASEEAESALMKFGETRKLVDDKTEGFIFDTASGEVFANNAEAATATLTNLQSAAIAAATRMQEAELKLQKFQLENRDKRSEAHQDALDDELEATVEHLRAVTDLELKTSLFEIAQDERVRLSRATVERDKLEITRTASLARVTTEAKAAGEILDLEEKLLRERLKTASPDRQKEISRRLEAITTERTVITTTTQQQKQEIELNYTLGKDALAAPGTLRELEEEIARDHERFANARSDEERKTIRERIRENERAVDRMKKSEKELLDEQRRNEEERKRLWLEQHDAARIALDAIGAGIRTFWAETILVHRQGKDVLDKVWIAIQNTVLGALGEILVAAITNAILSKLIVVPLMTEITAAATPAAVMTSIATFGGAAVVGSAAVLTGLATVRAATAFDQGGRLRRGEMGFFEGRRDEIVAPEENFDDLVKKKIPDMTAVMLLKLKQTEDANAVKPDSRAFAELHSEMKRLTAEVTRMRIEAKRKETSVFIGGVVGERDLVERNLTAAERRRKERRR